MNSTEKYKKGEKGAGFIRCMVVLVILYASSVFAQEIPSGSSGLTWTNDLGMEFRLIQPGSMIVGKIDLKCPEAPDNRDIDEAAKWTEDDFENCEELADRYSHPGFLVTIDKPYYIGKTEVTQEQWLKVMGTNPSFFKGPRVEGKSGSFPVENISWEQAQAFIKKLNEIDTSAKYRLPTEFEWEYAARAGNKELLSWKETKEQAWIQDINKGSPQPVGLMKPNAWGLYDMLGNVWEWVGDYYNNKTYPDPVPPTSGEVHVLKGGSFISDVVNATYFEHAGGPGNGYDVGFRIVKEANQ